MKVQTTKSDVTVNGAMSTDSFTIKASAHAFEILSSNLYANKIGSMIRELSTNAYDAHIMVDKKDEPFVITLPNTLDPTFKIRDFGPGLSHSEIMNVYTTFFESTKTNSNDVVGCLGLGSKSPFGVSETFTIVSFYNGKKSIYSAFLNDIRIPSIAKFAEIDTDEENGIEIEVAIKEEDFYTFSREVASQLKYFDVKPIINGNSTFKWLDDEEYLYEGTTWKMVKNGNNPRVLQGQIQYPINISDMGHDFDNASPAVKSLLSCAILMEVNIGDVNIAPSREALSYDKRTSLNIIAHAEKILVELPIMIQAAIQDCKTEYEAKLKYKDIMNQLNMGRYSRNPSLVNHINKSGDILWKGIDVSSTDIIVDKDCIISATYFKQNNSGSRFNKSNYSSHVSKNNDSWTFQATDLDHTLWIYATPNDKSIDGRSKQYAKDQKNKNVTMNIIKTELTLQKLSNKLGLTPKHFIKASTLDKVKRKNVVKGKVTPYVLSYKDHSYGNSKNDIWSNLIVTDLNELEGYYVDIDRFDVSDNIGRPISQFKEMVQGAIALKYIDKDSKIYGLRKVNQKKKHNLINFFDHIKIQSEKTTLKPKYIFGNGEAINKIMNGFYDFKLKESKIPVTSPFRKILDAMLENTKADYSTQAKLLIAQFELHSDTIDMTVESQKLDEYYPLISLLNYYYSSDKMIDYILQMDELREFRAQTLKN